MLGNKPVQELSQEEKKKLLLFFAELHHIPGTIAKQQVTLKNNKAFVQYFKGLDFSAH